MTTPEFEEGRITIPEYAEVLIKHFEWLNEGLKKYEGKWTDELYEEYNRGSAPFFTDFCCYDKDDEVFHLAINSKEWHSPWFTWTTKRHKLEIVDEKPVQICSFTAPDTELVKVKGKHRNYHFIIWKDVSLVESFYKNPIFASLGVDGRTVEIKELVKKCNKLTLQKVEDEIKKDSTFQKLLSLAADGVLTFDEMVSIKRKIYNYNKSEFYSSKLHDAITASGKTPIKDLLNGNL